MTSPSFFINRLVVSGELHCDITFKHGLNILQSTDDNQKNSNKSGKTALVELIQHGLGKAQKNKTYHFSPIIDKIKTLWLEIETNGSTFTIERSLQALDAGIKIYESAYVPGIENSNGELVHRDRMSSVLLYALGIPEVSVRKKEGDLISLTFPLLMRAFILHQADSFGAILDKIQPDQRRTDIIGLLTGITPLERYTLEDKISEVQLEVQRLDKYYSSVQDFLNKNGVPSLIGAEVKVKEAEDSLTYARGVLHNIQQEIKDQSTNQNSPISSGQVDNLRREILLLKEQINEIESDISGLQKELERLREVRSSLKVDSHKFERLQVSSFILSTVEFSVCPRCLLEVTSEMKQREESSRCSLCNRSLSITSDTPPRSIQTPKDIGFQIQEIETLIENVQKELKVKSSELEKFYSRQEELGQIIDRESQVYVSPSLDRVLAQSHIISQKEGELAAAQGLLNQARALHELRKPLDDLKKQLGALEDQLREVRKAGRERLEVLRQIYQDILTQIDFPDFSSCSIDSQSLMPNINNQLYMHVGVALTGLATVSYHLAMFSMAQTVSTLFPQMLVIDSPAVGDLNEDNHENLLKYFASIQSLEENKKDYKSDSDINWQIILTTRKIIPELEPYIFKRINAHQMLLDGLYS